MLKEPQSENSRKKMPVRGVAGWWNARPAKAQGSASNPQEREEESREEEKGGLKEKEKREKKSSSDQSPPLQQQVETLMPISEGLITKTHSSLGLAKVWFSWR